MAASLLVSFTAHFSASYYVHTEGARVGRVSGAVGGGLCVRVGVCV